MTPKIEQWTEAFNRIIELRSKKVKRLKNPCIGGQCLVRASCGQTPAYQRAHICEEFKIYNDKITQRKNDRHRLDSVLNRMVEKLEQIEKSNREWVDDLPTLSELMKDEKRGIK